jgi:hypothetical protein
MSTSYDSSVHFLQAESDNGSVPIKYTAVGSQLCMKLHSSEMTVSFNRAVSNCRSVNKITDTACRKATLRMSHHTLCLPMMTHLHQM